MSRWLARISFRSSRPRRSLICPRAAHIPIADIRIAECELKTTQKRRWTRVNIDNRLVRLGTARYALDLELTEIPATSASRFKRRIGQCDIDLDAEGIQAGVPALREGDYTRLRRAEP